MNQRKEFGSIEFLSRNGREFSDRAVALARIAKRGLILHPWTSAMVDLAGRLSRDIPAVCIHVHESQVRAAGMPSAATWESVDVAPAATQIPPPVATPNSSTLSIRKRA